MNFTPILSNPFSTNSASAPGSGVDFSAMMLADLNRHLRQINMTDAQVAGLEVEADALVRLRDAAAQFRTSAFGPALLKLVGPRGRVSHLDITVECHLRGRITLTTMSEAIDGTN